MDPLVAASVRLQKLARRFGARLLVVVLAGLWVALRAAGASGSLNWIVLGLMVAFTAWLGASVRAQRRTQLEGESSLAFFWALITVTEALPGMLPDGVARAVTPLGFVVLMVGAAQTRARLRLAAYAAGLQLALYVASGQPGSLAELAVRLAFCGVFLGISGALFRRELARVQKWSEARLEAEVTRLRDDARAYRLVGGAESEEKAAQSAALEVGHAVDFALSVLRRSGGLDTAAYYTLEPGGRLTLRSAASERELARELSGTEGLFSIVAGRKERVELLGERAMTRSPVYRAREAIGGLGVVPHLVRDQVAGLLYVDRSSTEALSEATWASMEEAVQFIERTLDNERVFSRLERQAREQGKLYRAAEALSAATSEAAVIEAAVESAREIAAFDFAAVTLFHKKSGTHEICAVSGGNAEALVGVSFRQNAGLVSMVVANRHPLPYRGDFDAQRQVLFARGHDVVAMPSLLVLPLIVHDRVLGTLVLGSEQRGAFSEMVRPVLEVLASHMSVSLSNARMLKRLEEQATTDGMTGLLNKKTLIAAAERRIKVATRFGKPLSVLVADIDFFKKVNDTYGHDVGDVVIKGLGEVLKRAQRDTDLMGRFGGEEFVIVCEQTDENGALNLAERIRKELEVTTFQTDLGPLSVTCSIGVATFPHAGKDWDAIFKATDEALYVSKRSGRNRVTAWKPKLKGVGAA
jgi:two-component system, cell cycle response regulator